MIEVLTRHVLPDSIISRCAAGIAGTVSMLQDSTVFALSNREANLYSMIPSSAVAKDHSLYTLCSQLKSHTQLDLKFFNFVIAFIYYRYD
jgi:hypothetical protein